MATGTGTAAVLPDGPDYLHLTLLLYGSAKGDPVGDERLGEHQRRAEIELRLKLPHAGMSAHEIQQSARGFVGLHYPNIKHTQKWYCEFCDKPARMSQQDMMAWTHLSPPRINAYFHFVCNPSVGPCAARVREAHIMVAQMSGFPPRPKPPPEDPSEFPPMAACAGCQREETAEMQLKKCSGCNLTRYCSPACQRAHWREHKGFCKVPKTVTWIWE